MKKHIIISIDIFGELLYVVYKGLRPITGGGRWLLLLAVYGGNLKRKE